MLVVTRLKSRLQAVSIPTPIPLRARLRLAYVSRVRSFVRRARTSSVLSDVRFVRPFVRSAVGPSSRRRVRATRRVFLFRSNACVPSLALGFTKMYTFAVLWYILNNPRYLYTRTVPHASRAVDSDATVTTASMSTSTRPATGARAASRRGYSRVDDRRFVGANHPRRRWRRQRQQRRMSGNGWLDKLLDAVTPKDATGRGEDSGAEDYETWYANADGGTRAVCACVRGTVLDGRVVRAAYDAEKDGYAARAFHAAVDGAGPCVVVGRTKAGSRFAGFNPLGFYGVEDYRSCASAFLAKWESEKAYARGEPPKFVANALPGGNSAIFDYGSQGPCFGVDGLRIPLGMAPLNGSSYAGVGGSYDLGETNASGSRSARSRLGTHYEGFSDGTSTLFAPSEGMDAELVELKVFCAPSLRREDDGLYVS